jgi:BirA family biotin operon repressor/biotin-[acetyl-CoA-carboxylase] ligase
MLADDNLAKICRVDIFLMNIGTVIKSFETCTSTNDVAKKLAEEGAEEGTVVLAGEQTKGRGTQGRSWYSPRGQGLYASVILRPKQSDISLLPLMAGVACAEALRRAAGLEVKLKWPNDIVWRKKKLGGILCESGLVGNSVIYAILGLGLNIGQKKNDFPEGFRRNATSLWLILKKKVDRARLERSLWQSLDRWYRVFSLGRKEEVIRAFESNFSVPIGKIVNIKKKDESFSGVFLGIDSRARLRLRREGRQFLLSLAELQSIE